MQVGTRKQTILELQEDDEGTKRWKEKLRKLKKRKKHSSIQEEMNNPSLHRVCLEILNEDDRVWQAKKRKIEAQRKKIEEDEESQRKKMIRLATAERKKKKLLKTMRFKGKLKPTEEERKKIELRKRYWRNFRDPVEEYDVDESTLEAGNISNDDAGCDAAASKKVYREKDERKTGREELGKERKDIEYPETYASKILALKP